MESRLRRDESIELADRALKMTKVERIQEFVDLLNEAQGQKSSKTNVCSSFTRAQRALQIHDVEKYRRTEAKTIR